MACCVCGERESVCMLCLVFTNKQVSQFFIEQTQHIDNDHYLSTQPRSSCVNLSIPCKGGHKTRTRQSSQVCQSLGDGGGS